MLFLTLFTNRDFQQGFPAARPNRCHFLIKTADTNFKPVHVKPALDILEIFAILGIDPHRVGE